MTFADTASPPPAAGLSAPVLSLGADAAEQRPTAYVYSEGYQTRRRIHMIASYATLPLFVAQYYVGQQLYDGDYSESTKSAHSALTVGIASLFVVNTVTGVWNLWEGRNDPNGRTRRWVHGILMMGANVGFVATGAMAPDDDDEGDGGSSASSHRTVALTSMGIAAASYVYMLVTR